VQVLTSSSDPTFRSPENDALLQWIAMHDPALVAKVQTVEPKGLLDVPYRPSYLTLRTEPLGAPPDPPAIHIPQARDPLAYIRSVTPSALPDATAPEAQPTRVLLPAALQSRSTGTSAIVPQTKTIANVRPTIVLAGVDRVGETRFTFLQQASGDPALDADALTYIRGLRFTPSDTELRWDTITIEWGDDVLAPK
jgi:outer membrane biosynthesis protein TonB